MDLLRKLLLLVLPFLCISCAKTEYLLEQGLGQLRLQISSVDNQKMLADVSVAEDVKSKIRRIEKFKEYFYSYFARKKTDIYSQTTMLKDKAVTYLVVASKYYEIKPRQECFIFMGCFPYLGFFKENSAKEYQQNLERDDYVTWRRPVYAYSTLGYFTDNILSSFFYYDDFQLAEMIFHELFHTIFFIKDEIDLNENLANYFGTQMALEYFQYSSKMRKEHLDQIRNYNQLRIHMVELIDILKKRYSSIKGEDRRQYQMILDKFIAEDFRPSVEKKCNRLKLKKCFPLKMEWNNASFSAFLTYEKDVDYIKTLHSSHGSLLDFYKFLESEYRHFKDDGTEKTFTAYLKKL